jgi:hypothetical protein
MASQTPSSLAPSAGLVMSSKMVRWLILDLSGEG